jgi:hypothetical protein
MLPLLLLALEGTHRSHAAVAASVPTPPGSYARGLVFGDCASVFVLVYQ